MLDPAAATLWIDRRTAVCIHHALLLQRADLAPGDESLADAVVDAALGSLGPLHLDDEARRLGLRDTDLAAVRFALLALLDESAARHPGAERRRERLFRRAGLPPSANVGHDFFETLQPRLADPAPSPADLAVLHIHALCLQLGLRGRYGARVDAAPADLAHLLRRLHLKLRPCLSPRPPPPFAPVPGDIPRPPPRWPLRLAALALLAALAHLFALHAGLEHNAAALRTHLAAVP